MINTGSAVEIVDILDKIDGKHLISFIGKRGEVISWHYLNQIDKENDNKRCKVRINGTDETYYFISKGELKEV